LQSKARSLSSRVWLGGWTEHLLVLGEILTAGDLIVLRSFGCSRALQKQPDYQQKSDTPTL
jgi:hypothetical protein